ncbi:serum paraoxonase/arylesterase family protein [Aspergillus foveolatus]|uniref:serum paraoxonase/arylesterase family protein n=1 Tax=Aspergillus foveolatus TaxID=210207 RepID=UPI003CCCA3BD
MTTIARKETFPHARFFLARSLLSCTHHPHYGLVSNPLAAGNCKLPLPSKVLSTNKNVQAAVLLAVSLPYLQSRQYPLTLFLKNKPENLEEINKFSSSALRFANTGVRNCEDGIIVEEDAFAILSCDPGRDLWNTVMGTFYPHRERIPNGKLWLYRYEMDLNLQSHQDEKKGEAKVLQPIVFTDTPDDFSFHPLGVEYHRDTATLFVCNHHIDGSRVDVFVLDAEGKVPVARHVRSVIHPLLPGPNSIIALNGHELYVTNDHYMLRKEHPFLSLFETYAGIPGGTVAYVKLGDDNEPVEVRTVARGPFVNGVTLLNETTLAVAISAAAEVRLYRRLPDNGLEFLQAIKMPLLPDNLSTDKDGALLIAGHPHPPSLEKAVRRRRECIDAQGLVPQDCWKSTAPSWVARWTEAKGVENLYVTTSGFGSSATAAKDAVRNVGIVTGLYENGILVWKE